MQTLQPDNIRLMKTYPMCPTQSRQFSSARHLHRGITLVEILVVITIIVVLAGVGLSTFKRAKEQAKSSICLVNLKQLGTALLSYSADHNNEVMPLHVTNADGSNGGIWPVVLARAGYLGDLSIGGPLPSGNGFWNCPACDPMGVASGGYGIVEGISRNSTAVSQQRRISTISRQSKTWLVGDVKKTADPKSSWYAIRTGQSPWASGGGPAVGRHGPSRINVCMFDGHVEALTRQEIVDGKYTAAD